MSQFSRYKLKNANTGVYKKKQRYLNFDYLGQNIDCVLYQSFKSRTGIYYKYYHGGENGESGLIVGNRLYDIIGKRVLLEDYGSASKVYNYEDFTEITEYETLEYDFSDEMQWGIVLDVRGLLQLDASHTLLDILPNMLVMANSAFTQSDSLLYPLKHHGETPTMIIKNGICFTVTLYIREQNKCMVTSRANIEPTGTVACPYGDSCITNNCILNSFLNNNGTPYYVVNCNGRIRAVDGKISGKRTKPAIRITEEE